MTLRAVLVLLVLSGGASAAPPLLNPPTARPTATADTATAGAAAGSAAPSRGAEPAAMSAAPDGLGEGERVVLPPMPVPQAAPTPDRRPTYVGLGLVVMAIALWWNRRQRDRFDREDDRARRPRRARDVERDADADDLHAAARGDAAVAGGDARAAADPSAPNPPATDPPAAADAPAARSSRQDV